MILLNGNKINMEVDTGTTVIVMSKATWEAMENHPPLKKNQTPSYTLNVLGTREVNIDYLGQHYMLPVIVVTSKGLNMLSKK